MKLHKNYDIIHQLMKNQHLKDNEILMFIDFNNTLVDYENEYNEFIPRGMNEVIFQRPAFIRKHVLECLRYFEKTTGLTPVVCVVTNAKPNLLDINGSYGIFEDFKMTFFPPYQQNNDLSKDCSRYFQFITYAGTDYYYKIHGDKCGAKMFEKKNFSLSIAAIHYASSFKKKEMADRMLTMLDPTKNTSKYIIFAGDSIKDDYPMKEIPTPDGVCKIFIRPFRAKKFPTPYVKLQFAQAKGEVFTMKNQQTGKFIKHLDYNNVQYLSSDEQLKLENYSSGDIIYLTQKNSRGLIDGLYKAAEFIANKKNTPEIEME